MKVAIYSAISGVNENLPVERSWVDVAKLRTRRAWNLISWKATGLTKFDAWVYRDRKNSNVGDMAIRLSIENLITRASGGPLEFLEFQWGELNDLAVHQINQECALFVIGGSGYFHLDEHGGCSDRLSSDLSFLKSISIPQVVFGAGVNINLADSRGIRAAPTQDASKVFREVLSEMRAISVRDELSREILQPLCPREISIIPDPAIVFADFAECGRDVAAVPGRRRPVIGLNFGFQSHFSSEIFRLNLNAYISVLKELRRRCNPHFYYFVHTDPERMVPDLLSTSGFDVQSVVGSAEKLIDVYRRLDVHVCQMLHSSILALSVNVPTVNMAYDLKNRGFFELMGLAEYCIPVRPLDAELLLTLVEKCMVENDQIRRNIVLRKEGLTQSLTRFAQECALIAKAS